MQCGAAHGLVLHLHAVVLSSCWAELFLCGSHMVAAVLWLWLLSVCRNASINGGGEVVAESDLVGGLTKKLMEGLLFASTSYKTSRCSGMSGYR